MPTTDELQHEELDVAIQTQRWVVVVPNSILSRVVGLFDNYEQAEQWRKVHEPKGFSVEVEDPLEVELSKFLSA